MQEKETHSPAKDLEKTEQTKNAMLIWQQKWVKDREKVVR